jgi:hypothetical protein
MFPFLLMFARELCQLVFPMLRMTAYTKRTFSLLKVFT